MPFVPFYELCLDTAKKETRRIQLTSDDNIYDLPMGFYHFTESYCDECNCKKVFINVLKDDKLVATIDYGWAKPSFYKKQFSFMNKRELKEFKGPVIAPFQHQSEYSNRIFKMFMDVLFTDKEYMARIEAHYNEFRKQF